MLGSIGDAGGGGFSTRGEEAMWKERWEGYEVIQEKN